MANKVILDNREYRTYESQQEVERRYSSLKRKFNRNWTESGIKCEIKVRHSEQENGQPYFYLMGYVNGRVRQYCGSQTATWNDFNYIELAISGHVCRMVGIS